MIETCLARRLVARLGMTGFGAALASALLLASGDAAATLTLGTAQIILPNGYTQQASRPSADQFWINYEDCKNDVAIQWTVDTTDASFSWAASANATCPPSSGTVGTWPLQQCWQPATGAAYLPSGSTVTIHAQELVKGTLGISSCEANTATGGISWPQPVTVFFYSDSSTPDSATWTQTAIALTSPDPPPGFDLTAGDQGLVAVLPRPGTQPLDPLVQGYDLFCYPLPAAGDAGAISTCPAGTTIPGLDPLHPDPSSPYLCAQGIPSSTTEYALVSLQAGQTYAVGMALYDAVGNVGPLSDLRCGNLASFEGPATVAPGSGGGSSCAVRGAGTSGAGAGALGIAGLLGLAMASRARRRR